MKPVTGKRSSKPDVLTNPSTVYPVSKSDYEILDVIGMLCPGETVSGAHTFMH